MRVKDKCFSIVKTVFTLTRCSEGFQWPLGVSRLYSENDIFKIHFTNNRHLCHFKFSVINNTVMNILLHILYMFKHFSNLRLELLNHRIYTCSDLLDNVSMPPPRESSEKCYNEHSSTCSLVVILLISLSIYIQVWNCWW